MFKSLKGRLILVASLVLIVFIGLAGFALDTAYQLSLEKAKRQELSLHIHSLLIVAEPSETVLSLPEVLPDARFNSPSSGLYAFASESSVGTFWQSESALEVSYQEQAPFKVSESKFYRRLLAGEAVFSYQHAYGWQTLDGKEKTFVFTIMETTAGFEEQAAGFRNTLWTWLAVLAGILIIIQWMVMIWGLSPLGKMANELHAIESGRSDRLEGDYPEELQGVTDNLNILVNNERRQRERYRTTMADLAHSLKTPLAILNGIDVEETSRGEMKNQVRDQVDRMNQIVAYQLQRAVSASPSSILTGVSVKDAVSKILGALEKVYRHRTYDFKVAVDEHALFFGDQGDLMELLGNLLDNAYKYGDDRAELYVQVLSSEGDKRPGLEINLEDNGPGIPDQKKEALFQRGERADTQVAGQGIGLAVVNDIVSSYGGDIKILDSKLGGAHFRLRFH